MTKETIKAKVLQTARRDPFLSIDEIAAIVRTTPRYVRTILSESQVSLMQLRKSYAKTMEKKLTPLKQVTAPVTSFDPQLKLGKVKDPVIARLLAVDPNSELLQISRLQHVKDIAAFVQLTTYAQIRLTSLEGSLRQLVAHAGDGELEQKELWVEVVTNESELSQLLTTNDQQPLLKLCYLLYNDGIAVAVETHWLPSEGILLKGDSSPLEIRAEFGS